MKIEFEDWGIWNEEYEAVVLHGTVDGQGFALIYAAEVLAELFDVSNKPNRLEGVFKQNMEFMQHIGRSVIEAGMLRWDGIVILERKDLLPYFEKRAATAPA